MITKANKRNEKLVNARNKSQLTQAFVADKSGISVRYYQKLEAGTSKPTFDVAKIIAKTLGVNVEAIF